MLRLLARLTSSNLKSEHAVRMLHKAVTEQDIPYTLYRYDEDHTVLNQTIVINGSSVECYNIWEHCFTKDALLGEAQAAGFTQYEVYGDVCGTAFNEHGSIICAVFAK